MDGASSSGFFVTANGWEYNLVLAGGAVAVAIMGAGSASSII